MGPRIGVGVFVLNPQGRIIIGKRQGSHGAGTWGLPGGHLEFNETFEACAKREVFEETGLKIKDIKFLTATNDIMRAEGKHYVTVFVGGVVTEANAQPKVIEPEKCAEWQWQSWEEIGEFAAAQKVAEVEGSMDSFEGKRLFMPLLDLFEQRRGFHPYHCFQSHSADETA
ncbi:hypothetical protein EYZ11_004169 [Aspergillus tanneri]|uniref:Nudix hydrolase domain-containing protein n=1 Tax=Aspergillus tanneri TaxID=1220188 RepID=A0A4V3UPT2_9EURO|nr:uncharacterized protein ATNIH1004_000946 [Aspergillus tanneri]KAA8652045.1 hypothetical protein ATNIH1004_000946 [Aspergillus tanneri]THC96354.1 hypothetical protein EYZ11_004169 [Aspergillus tanneri]